MSKFNTGALKSALREAGHRVSEGEEMLAQDMEEFFAFAWLRFGLSKEKASYALAYPHTVTQDLPGHPGNDPETQEAIENESSTASTPTTRDNPAPGAYNVGATAHAAPSVASHPEEVGTVLEGGEPAPEAGKVSETSTGTLGGENSTVVATQPETTLTPSTELSSNSSLPISAGQQQVLQQAKVDQTTAPVDEDKDAPESVLVTQPGQDPSPRNAGDITHSQEGLPQDDQSVRAHDYAATTPQATQGISDTAQVAGASSPADTEAKAEGDAVQPDQAEGEGATYEQAPVPDESQVGEGGTGVSGDQTPVTEEEQAAAPSTDADPSNAAADPSTNEDQAAAAPASFAENETADRGPVTDEVTSGAPAHTPESLTGSDAEANAKTSDNNPVTADTTVPTTDQPVTEVQEAQAAAAESQEEATEEQKKAAAAQTEATEEQKKATDAQGTQQETGTQSGGATN